MQKSNVAVAGVEGVRERSGDGGGGLDLWSNRSPGGVALVKRELYALALGKKAIGAGRQQGAQKQD